MIRLFFPGQKVPEWLEKQHPIKGFENQWKPCEIKFASLVLVWDRSESYCIANLLWGPQIKVYGGMNVNIVGQSPNGLGGVHHYSSLFSAWGW